LFKEKKVEKEIDGLGMKGVEEREGERRRRGGNTEGGVVGIYAWTTHFFGFY
jgi:hypothetical protein